MSTQASRNTITVPNELVDIVVFALTVYNRQLKRAIDDYITGDELINSEAMQEH